MKQRVMVAIITILILTIGGVILYGKTKENKNFKIEKQDSEASNIPLQATEKDAVGDIQDSDSFIYCYICGEVLSQGVYKVRDGSRIIDVLNEAGGFTKDAYQLSLNLAERVYDGEMIYVPSVNEATPGASYSPGNNSVSGLININTADLDTLMTLPGIGESKAKAIIDYRTRYGRFESVDEIKNVSGIGEGTLDKFRSMITI